MQVSIEKHSITITSKVFASLTILQNEFMHWESNNAQALKEAFPNDYEYVMVGEEYQLFLMCGSPQIHELGWSMKYEASSNSCSLSFHNMEKSNT